MVRVLGGPNSSKGDSTFVRRGFSTTLVIIVIMRVLVDDPPIPGPEGLESGTREPSC
jgi:hypothetical protein